MRAMCAVDYAPGRQSRTDLLIYLLTGSAWTAVSRSRRRAVGYSKLTTVQDWRPLFVRSAFIS